MLADRMKLIQESKTSELNAKIKQLIVSGNPIINFATGELDYDTSSIIKHAAKQAIDEGRSKYTDTMGILELRTLIAQQMSSATGVNYRAAEVGVTAGAKQALFNAIMAITNPGDEIIIPSPYWVTFPEQVKLAGGQPVFLDTKPFGYEINIDKLNQLITPKTRAIIINSPHNPTGMIVTKQILDAMTALAVESNFWIIYDECYSEFVFHPHTHHRMMNKDHTIFINSFSKSSAVTGWRIGYICGPETIIQASNQLQSHVSSNPCSIAQHGMIGAFTNEHKQFLDQIRTELQLRFAFICEQLNSIPFITYIPPQGTFYVFINIQNIIGKKYLHHTIKTTTDFALHLLENEKVAVIPGEVFNDPTGIRLSFALSLEDIKVGMHGLRKFIEDIHASNEI